MFEYSYNPIESISDKEIKFSFDNMIKIADITYNLWDNSDDIYYFLNTYDQPFWHIWENRKSIKIEIHADLSVLDAKWAENKFKESVDKAVQLLLEDNFRKHGDK